MSNYNAHLSLGLANMLSPEQELSVEITDIDCIQINLNTNTVTVNLSTGRTPPVHQLYKVLDNLTRSCETEISSGKLTSPL